MALINLVVVLIVIGILLYCINSFIPMDAKIKQIVNIVVIVAVLLWILSVFGLFSSFSTVRVGPGSGQGSGCNAR